MSEQMVEWQPIRTAPEGVVVLTAIIDGDGQRNTQSLLRRGHLWWTPDGGMYVYYAPTHWQPIQERQP